MEFFIGGIINFGGNFAPRDWAFCDGQLISISQNQALFAILGTIWGGDGRTNFALPDIRSRVPIGVGQGAGLTPSPLGEKKGYEKNVLSIAQLPQHNHVAEFNPFGSPATPLTATATVNAFEGTGEETSPKGNYWSTAQSGVSALTCYQSTANTTMAADAVDITISGGTGGITGGTVTIHETGASNPFNIMQPSLGMQYIICQQGIFPSRN